MGCRYGAERLLLLHATQGGHADEEMRVTRRKLKMRHAMYLTPCTGMSVLCVLPCTWYVIRASANQIRRAK